MKLSKHSLAWILALTLPGFVGERLNAQLKGPKYDERLLFRGLTGITMSAWQQEWKLKGEGNVVEQSVPAFLSVPLSNRILLSIANAPAISKLDSMKLQGITDTRIAFSYVVPGDKVWINGGASLPTGVTKLTENELRVATIISQTAFDYRVPVFGQGVNGNLGFAYAYAAQRRLILGFGTSYVYKGEYQPASITGSSGKYDPGDEISVNAGLDYTTFSKTERFSADITITNYLPDKLNGQNFIQSGLRFMTMAVYSLKWGSITHLLQFRTRLRTQSEIFNSGVGEKFKSSQHYELQYTALWFPVQWCSLSGILQGKYHTGDQIPIGVGIYETGKAQIGSVGGELGFAIASWFGITLDAKYGIGSVVVDNVKNNVTGFEVGGGGRVQF
jgi:hypothetical protein